MLPVGGQTHNIIPIEIPQLRQMIPVEAGIISKNRGDTVFPKPLAQVCNSLAAGAENGLYRSLQEQRVVVHTTDLTFRGEDMILSVQHPEGIGVCDESADAHDPVCPIGFCVDYCESTHGVSSYLLFLTV